MGRFGRIWKQCFLILGDFGAFFGFGWRISGDGGAENAFAFGVRRTCVLGETSLRLEANASAFEVKCTCVLEGIASEGDLGGRLLDLDGCLDGGVF